MKIRTDFVTNSSSSSYITIIATRKDGSTVEDWLESEGFPDQQIYFSDSIETIVGPDTANGNEILENIREMYCSPRIDYLLDESEDPHPLRDILDLKEFVTVEIQEKVYGEILEDQLFENDEGDSVYPEFAQVTVVYDVQNDCYSKMEYSAQDEDGNELSVIFDDWDEEDDE